MFNCGELFKIKFVFYIRQLLNTQTPLTPDFINNLEFFILIFIFYLFSVICSSQCLKSLIFENIL